MQSERQRIGQYTLPNRTVAEPRCLEDGEPRPVWSRIPQIDCDFTDLGRGFRYKNQYLAAFLGARSWRTRWVKRIWPPFGSISTAA